MFVPIVVDSTSHVFRASCSLFRCLIISYVIVRIVILHLDRIMVCLFMWCCSTYRFYGSYYMFVCLLLTVVLSYVSLLSLFVLLSLSLLCIYYDCYDFLILSVCMYCECRCFLYCSL